MRDAGGPKIPLTSVHKKVSSGGQAKEAVGGGSNVGTGPPVAVLCSWGCLGTSGGFQVPGAPICPGYCQHPGNLQPAAESPNNVGSCQASPRAAQYLPLCQSKVLEGGGTDRAALWQKNMGSFEDCLGKS
jgi:hypothetical protein